jgi:hypothetical protein
VRDGDLRLLSAGTTRNIHLEAENGALREFVEQLQSRVGALQERIVELQERIVEVERKIGRSCRSTPWAAARRWCRQAASPHRRVGPAPRSKPLAFGELRDLRPTRPRLGMPLRDRRLVVEPPCSRTP